MFSTVDVIGGYPTYQLKIQHQHPLALWVRIVMVDTISTTQLMLLRLICNWRYTTFTYLFVMPV